MQPYFRLPAQLETPSDAQDSRKTPERGLKMSNFSKAVLFARIFLFAAAVPFLLRLKIARVAALLEPGREPRPVNPDLVKKIIAYVETVIQRGRPLIRPGCLTLGVTRYYFLRRAGLDLSLHFGMGRVGKEKAFVGHCWLVRQGEPYLERDDPRPLYTEMYHISRENSRKPVTTGAMGLGRLTHP
jgi:Transglutaminase-like superfamily